MAITIDDFSKIWASTSPLTPYTFSESNYKEGWNFVGSTPPSRQMWDFLQKNNDEKMQYLADNYLPLSGGTLTGDVNGVTPSDNDDSTKLATTEFVDNVFLAKIISKLQETGSLPSGTSFPSASMLSKMIENMMTQDGVQYNFENPDAWYVKFGAKYGRFIIQGGIISASAWGGGTTTTLIPPIRWNTISGCYIGGVGSLYYGVWSGDENSIDIRVSAVPPYTTRWVAFGW